jgi:hypothetical protein
MPIYNLKNPRDTPLTVAGGSQSLYFLKINPATNNPIRIKGIDITPQSVTAADTKPTLSLIRISDAGTFNSDALVAREHELSGQACPGTFSNYASSAPTIASNGDIYTWYIPATAPFVYRFQPGEEPIVQSGELFCWLLSSGTSGMTFHANVLLENG